MARKAAAKRKEQEEEVVDAAERVEPDRPAKKHRKEVVLEPITHTSHGKVRELLRS